MTTTLTRPPTPGRRRLLPAAAGLVVLTALAPMSWGTTYSVTTELLPPDHPLFAALMRTLPGGLLLIALARRLPRGDWWWKAAVLGALNIGIFQALLFVTAERLPGGVAATLGAVQPLVVAGLAVLVLRERPTAWRTAWSLVGVVGIGLVVLEPTARFDGVGILAGLAGAAAMALGVTLVKRWGAPPGVGPLTYAGWQLAAGGLVLLPLTALVEGVPPGVDGAAVAGYVWLGTVGGFVAYALWFRGIRLLPVTATTMLGLLSPLVAATIGALLLGESLTAGQLAGFGLALTAMVAAQRDHAPSRLRLSGAVRS